MKEYLLVVCGERTDSYQKSLQQYKKYIDINKCDIIVVSTIDNFKSDFAEYSFYKCIKDCDDLEYPFKALKVADYYKKKVESKFLKIYDECFFINSQFGLINDLPKNFKVSSFRTISLFDNQVRVYKKRYHGYYPKDQLTGVPGGPRHLYGKEYERNIKYKDGIDVIPVDFNFITPSPAFFHCNSLEFSNMSTVYGQKEFTHESLRKWKGMMVEETEEEKSRIALFYFLEKLFFTKIYET